MNTYGPLLRNLQVVYPEYKFELIPIVVGAPGYVPKFVLRECKQWIVYT